MSAGDSRSQHLRFLAQKETAIAILAVAGIALHLILAYALDSSYGNYPLYLVLLFGGVPLVLDLAAAIARGRWGSDLLAGVSIVTSVILGEYLAGSLVVLMLSGGETLEAYAAGRASSVLRALANRMPATARVRRGERLEDVPLAEIAIGDHVQIYPHETCPIDGTVVEGHSVMDESYLTGEPYHISKSPGSTVLSGAINGDSLLTVQATKLAVDSRYARILQVMQASAQERPKMRRLGDQLGALYTPFALIVAVLAWAGSGEVINFLAVLVVATPCPLLIGIPVAIVGAISLAAKRSIVIRDPAVLEQIGSCRTIIFDKTGTLTYGEAKLTDEFVAPGHTQAEVLSLVASLERYSKHPLAKAIIRAAKERKLILKEAESVTEPPGMGLTGRIGGHEIKVTSRKAAINLHPDAAALLPEQAGGLECAVLIDGKFAALYRFRDLPRAEGQAFIHHLDRHNLNRVLLVSGDRESEVQFLADKVGIENVYSGKSPEEKVEIVKRETARAKTIFVGDGINDAPALMAATVGIAFGQNSDVTIEAAGAVVMDSSLAKVDEFFHIGRRMKSIALQSAVGGIALSTVGMALAAFGYLPPVAGAVVQEIIDILAVTNSLRAGMKPRELTDF